MRFQQHKRRASVAETPDRDRAERPERPHRPGGKPSGRRPDTGRPKRGAPNEKRLWTSGGKPARGDRDARHPEPPEDRDPYGIKAVRSRHDDPEIPDDVQAKDLDRVARAQLRTLSKENAEEVARHMAMAARLIEEDPQLAHRHAVSAARRAGRIAVVRETLAITAYSIGDFALALRELRTYRRISGNDDQLPMMVDSERGLGRPDKALELARSVPRESLPVPVRVELAIAMSGARLDLGQTDAALAELQIPELDPDTAFSYSPALFDAYATVLEDLGRTDEAQQWFERSDRATAALRSDDDTQSEEETIEIAEEDVPVEADQAGSEHDDGH
jgi:tetratricopeptide (TPR) repeat protein